MAASLLVAKVFHLHMCPIQWHVKARWLPPLGLNAPIMAMLSLVQDLQWQFFGPNLDRGLFLQPPTPVLRATMNASKEDW